MKKSKQKDGVSTHGKVSHTLPAAALACLFVANVAGAQSVDSSSPAATRAESRVQTPVGASTNGPSIAADDTAQQGTVPDQPTDGSLSPQTTGAAVSTTGDVKVTDPEAVGSILDDDIRRLNTREPAIDDRPPGRKDRPDISTEDTPGIRISSFVLRPTVTESINTETTKDSGGRETRGFLETDMKTSLISDWSLHQLSITSEGTWQKNISGEGEEQPSFQIDGDLRLDLADRTTAHITGGYRFYREDTTDPNAILGASRQADVQEFTAGTSLEHQLGRIRGTVGLDLDRTVYSDVTLSDGSTLSLSDRNETSGTARARIGYELSPALIPFVEASVGKSVYDEKRDSAGYERSGNTYGIKAGAEIDLGEKLRGEASLGYTKAVFDDFRLSDIDALTVNANVAWSPLRGTDVNFGATTSIQPSTTPGEGGYVSHGLSTTVSHKILENLTGTVIGGIVFRDYPSSSENQIVYSTSAGLIWNINRYLDLTSTLGYELTDSKVGPDSQQWRAGIGLRLKR
ncbi:outer membrane beta-barrel protein [Oryzifoliimicrobium ureilyticus]|uniref:outer membrane beta-barrel protein n=1 Tax=Oryzifoliimicrobium ureilyticus TaxID=3113724 RepID=UPI0030763403